MTVRELQDLHSLNAKVLASPSVLLICYVYLLYLIVLQGSFNLHARPKGISSAICCRIAVD